MTAPPTFEVTYSWRDLFGNDEVNALHAEAFNHRVYSQDEWDWAALCHAHSLGWITARLSSGGLVGFVNVVSDGFVHAWLQDLMVASTARHHRIGVGLVHAARDHAKSAGCEWLHVDFDAELSPFYFGAAGFVPTTAGLIEL